jgi:hypothetical protein
MTPGALVKLRSGGRCEACSVHSLDECNGRGDQAHHVLRRAQGGTNDPSNLRWVSTDHHAWIHANPAEARELGLLGRSGRPTKVTQVISQVGSQDLGARTPEDAA